MPVSLFKSGETSFKFNRRTDFKFRIFRLSNNHEDKNVKQISKKIYSLTLVGVIILCVFFAGLPFSGCTPYKDPVVKTAFFLNTFVTITFYSEEDAAVFPDCVAILEKYEKRFSRTDPESELYQLNHAGGQTYTVSPETASLITDALNYCELTDGALDITIAPVMDLWNFSEAVDGQLPPHEASLKEALSHVDYTKVHISGCDITLEDPDAAIDLGFIAKGYIADRLKEYLENAGIQSALINLGGNIDLVGAKPDGGDYIIGVKRPFSDANDTITSLSIRDTSFVSSGVYERCFTTNGIFYHHILDAHTGYPVDNDLYQVSVLCDDSKTADALSTTLMILGKEKGTELIDSIDNAHALFVDSSYNLSYSADFPE